MFNIESARNNTRARKFKLGLIVNPFSGIGGALALKGSDGEEVRQKALSMGAVKQSLSRATTALTCLQALVDDFVVYTANNEMGQSLCETLGFDHKIVYQSGTQTESTDSIELAQRLCKETVDLIVFAGGDGTARNIFDAVGNTIPVVGIPAGCKIHSGVYAITPQGAGRVIEQVIKGELVSLMQAEVKDIDEGAFREGRVVAKHYGEMNVPQELTYIQAVKMGGKESDELVLADIAAEIIDEMQDNPDTYYVMGSGSTVDFIMQELGLQNTLLGVDLVKEQTVVASDLTAEQLLKLLTGQDFKLVITLIGGQGHVFGRGNQQISSELIRRASKQNLLIVATKNKLNQLNGKPLICDSGDIELDRAMSGTVAVITGYRDRVLYHFA
ncbi:ATP-NAD kinase family protein [Glaciecola sp. KUL10]|uniref:ATP-NAD kinase family protein n=1 Tax=Glaciecola sp. (strain KUL10) TaxID=2161813 RepID=UPI000D98A9A7|nr:ATP-NAD kinase family protein [Glaciecola sp. KUL10]GBL03425.1 ATP-NAD/AcoX kinase [Glaciecola sp. KUL10]